MCTAVHSDSSGHPLVGGTFGHVVLINTTGPLAGGIPQMLAGGRYPTGDCAPDCIRTADINLTGRVVSVRDIEVLASTGPNQFGVVVTNSVGIKAACDALGLGYTEHWGSTPPLGWVWQPAFTVGNLDPSQCGAYLVANQDWWLEFTDPVITLAGNPVPLPIGVPQPNLEDDMRIYLFNKVIPDGRNATFASRPGLTWWVRDTQHLNDLIYRCRMDGIELANLGQVADVDFIGPVLDRESRVILGMPV